MALFVNAISFLCIRLVVYPASVHGGTIRRALSDEDPTKRSRPVAPSTFMWEIIGKDIDGEVGTQSGNGVSLNADGSRVAVGAPNGGGKFPQFGVFGEGEVQVYERGANNNWLLLGKAIEGEKNGENSGHSVSLSGSGNRVAVGAPDHDKNGSFGQVRVYDYDDGDWVQYGQDLNGDNRYDYFGAKIRLSQDGSRLIVGAENGNGGTGNARVFADIDGTWVQIGQDLNGVAGGDDAGAGIAISANGERVALGAYRHNNFSGQTRIYKLVDSAWAQVGQDIDGQDGNDWSGFDVDLNYDGTRIIVGDHYAITSGGEYSGQARVFDEVDGTWVQVGGDIDGTTYNGYFGWSVGITDDGSRVAIAAFRDSDSDLFTGAVRVFDIVNNEWVQNGPDIDGEDYANFTPRVALSADGSTVAVGSPYNEGEGSITGVDDYYSWRDDDYYKTTYYGGHVRVFELVEQCSDSPLPFDYKTFGSINCGDVSNNRKACEDAIVASHCPDACNRCEEYRCTDSEASVLYQGQKGKCDLLESIDPDQVSSMCSSNEVKETCRETCAFCYVSLAPSLLPSVSSPPSSKPSVFPSKSPSSSSSPSALSSMSPSVSPSDSICLGSALAIDIKADVSFLDTEWTVKDSDNNIIAQGSPPLKCYTTRTWVCLPEKDDCYIFEITDYDGFNCDNDYGCCGEYTVTLDGTILQTGNDFDYSESVGFCLIPAEKLPTTSPSASISPSASPSASCTEDDSQLMIDLTTDKNQSSIAWTVKDDENNIIAQNGVLFYQTRTITRVCLPAASCYTFEITDSYGNGICCSRGDGEVIVILDGAVILTAAEFGYSESINFCV